MFIRAVIRPLIGISIGIPGGPLYAREGRIPAPLNAHGAIQDSQVIKFGMTSGIRLIGFSRRCTVTQVTVVR